MSSELEPGNEPCLVNRATTGPVHRLKPAIIAVDGPAASGKSTMGYLVADALDFLLFDTGVMYRAVTWAALDRSVPIVDEGAVSELAETIRIDIDPPGLGETDGRQCTVLVDDADVTWLIRMPEVDQSVSTVSAYPRVREALSAQQRRIGEQYGSGQAARPGIVMVGRDIGTVVLPTAGLKIYMDATPEERARRRHLELEKRGKAIPYDQILADIIQRDERDSRRALSPLRPADDAILVDTSDMTPDQVVEQILRLATEEQSS